MPQPQALDDSSPILQALQELIGVVAQLRNPHGGCPWDLAQTPQSLVPYIIEEAYETVDALQHGSRDHVCEELGDLLLQVVLQSQIASEARDPQQYFTLQQVASGISAKLVRRHPHVFGQSKIVGQSNAERIEQVHATWEQIKRQEAQGVNGEGNHNLAAKLEKYGRSLPPLTASLKISQVAAKAGFEWESADGVWEKFHEELGEFQAALESGDRQHQAEELGDLLFTVVNLARWYDLDPSTALQGTNHRFGQRIALMEAVAEHPLEHYDLEQLEALWQQAKAELQQGVFKPGAGGNSEGNPETNSGANPAGDTHG
jgi:XTP/dITP diphosphohydrolase